MTARGIGALRDWRRRREHKRCAEVRRHIHELVDGELPAWRRRRLERHVLRCLACCAGADELRELKAAIARVGGRPDPVVRARLLALVEDVRAGRVGADG